MIQHFRQQRTLSQPVRLVGTGYWTGQPIDVELRPAAADRGLVFVRSDTTPVRRISATTAHRIESDRRTCLTGNGATVEMVEHVLAGLAGMQIDNCEIVVNGREMPALDGSSQAVVEAIDSVAVVLQDALRPCLVVEEVICVGDQVSSIEVRPSAEPGLTIEYQLDYGPSPIPRQTVREHINPATFRHHLAPARTFLLRSEAETLRARGLGRNVTYQDLLVFGEGGPIDNQLRFPDECARHKALDIIGDLALAGCDIQGHLVAKRSGHRLNAQLAAAFSQLVKLGRSLRHSA